MATTEKTRRVGPRRAAAVPPALRAVPDVDEPRADPVAARAFGEVLGRAGDRPGLDAVLRPAAESLSALLSADRCSVYLRGAEDGCLHGRLGHPATLDPVLRRLTLDVTGEPVVRDAIRLRAPLPLPDAASDVRPAPSAAVRRQHTGSVLVVPIVAGSRVLGVLLVEDRDRRRRFGADLESTAGTFAALLGRWMDRTLRVAELAAARDALARERRATARITAVEHAAAGAASGSTAALLDAVARAAGSVVELRDAAGALLLRAAPAGDAGHPSPDQAACAQAARSAAGAGAEPAVLSSLRPGRPDAGSFVAAGVRTAAGAGEHVLLLLPDGGRPDATDQLIASRVAGALSGRESATREADDEALVSLLAGVLGGGLSDGAALALAARLGIDPAVARVVVLCPDGGPGAAAARTALPGWSPVEVPLGPEAVLALEVPRDVAPRAAAAIVLERLAGPTRLVVSAPSAGLAGLPRALREARGAAVVGGPDASLTVESLGPARLLATDPADAGALAGELLGPLLRPGSAGEDLVQTLRVFFAERASVTGTAGVLGLHANTIRHRFSRIRERTGLDVLGDVGDQLTAQTAIIALRSADPGDAR